MTLLRLQKILARGGVASRRQAEELVRAGRVTVNGKVAALGDRADPDDDVVKLDGKRVALPRRFRYFVLNKPRGFLTARGDQQGRPTVFDLLPPGQRRGLVAVGRLDFNTEGLLLITDDGDFAQRVAHPRHGCIKTYAVKVRGTPAEMAVDKLRRGIKLGGKLTAPARVTSRPGPRGARMAESSSWWTVQLSEGRTRQVREMFLRIGHPVQKLRRTAIGPVSDPHLPAGGVRVLTAAEVEALLRSSGEEAARRRPAVPAAARGSAGSGRRAVPRGEIRRARPSLGEPRRPRRRP